MLGRHLHIRRGSRIWENFCRTPGTAALYHLGSRVQRNLFPPNNADDPVRRRSLGRVLETVFRACLNRNHIRMDVPCQGSKSPNRLKFAHLEYEKNALDYQGAQLCLIQLMYISRSIQWDYIMSRGRPKVCVGSAHMCVRRATLTLTAGWRNGSKWWIDQRTGYPIKERSGVIRYFVRKNNELVWGESDADLQAQYP